jgi:hypothetical protein
VTTNSLVPEQWLLVGRGLDRQTGEPFVLVARNKDGIPTTWRVQRCMNSNFKVDWRVTAIQYSNGAYTVYGKRRALPDGRFLVKGATNLSDSKIDIILRDYAEGRSN